MKKSVLIAVLIAAVSAAQALGQDTADRAARAARAEAEAADAVANAAAEAADTLIRTTVSTFADTLISVYAGVPADTAIEISGNIYHDTLTGASADKPAGTPVSALIDTPAAAADVSAYTPADTPVKKTAGKQGEIFILPPYTFHIAFLAASAALIAATLYFFLTRRRKDSRRFLTTTRLAVLDKLVQRGCRHIEANYPDPALTPETVCNSLVTGKAYLDALFMNELGINVQDFIVQVRVNAIKNRLSAPQEQSIDINDICAECGFADRTEAERCFSAVCGGVGIAEFARFSKMQSQRQGQNI